MRGAHIPAFHVHHRRWALRLCDAPYSRRTNFLRSYLLAADGALCAELDAGARVQPTNYVVSNVKRMPMLKIDRNIRSQFGIGEAGILLSWSRAFAWSCSCGLDARSDLVFLSKAILLLKKKNRYSKITPKNKTKIAKLKICWLYYCLLEHTEYVHALRMQLNHGIRVRYRCRIIRNAYSRHTHTSTWLDHEPFALCLLHRVAVGDELTMNSAHQKECNVE